MDRLHQRRTIPQLCDIVYIKGEAKIAKMYNASRTRRGCIITINLHAKVALAEDESMMPGLYT